MRQWINLIERLEITLPDTFWRWFGDSKVIDDNGEPMIVYHGGDNWRVAPGVTWFTDSVSVADGYADQGYANPEIKPCFLRMEKPLDLRDPAAVEMVFPNGLSEFTFPAYANMGSAFVLRSNREAIQVAIEFARQNGFDGLIHPDSNVSNKGQHTSYVIWNARQVKAARFRGWEDESIYGDHARFDDGNNGAYDPESDDITEGK